MSDNIDRLITSSTQDPNVSQTANYTSVASVNIYQFMTEAYSGTGGFRTGSYLVSHDREMSYDSRRDMCFYRNFLRPILRAMIEPCFTEDCPRVVKDLNGNVQDDMLFNHFIEDCNNSGTPLQSFSQEVLEYARLHGGVFVVMDNFSEQPSTELQAKENRIFPYVYIKNQQQVKGWKIDEFKKLESIIFYDHDDEKGNHIYRQWTKEFSVLVKETKENVYEQVEQQKFHNLGVVPVISVYSTKTLDNSILTDPPLFDLAKINFTIFNKDSEIRSLERNQGFSVFYLQSDQTGNLTLGSKNVLYLPVGTTIVPGFASPDSAILAGLQDSNTKLREDLFRIAEQSGVIGVQSASGVAIQWSFFAHESVLKKTSYIATNFELACAELFQLYTNQEFIYEVKYPEDFQPNDKMAELKLYDTAMMMDLPPLAKSKLKEKIANLLFSDIDGEELKEIIDEIRQEKEDELTSRVEDNAEETPIGEEGMNPQIGEEENGETVQE